MFFFVGHHYMLRYKLKQKSRRHLWKVIQKWILELELKFRFQVKIFARIFNLFKQCVYTQYTQISNNNPNFLTRISALMDDLILFKIRTLQNISESESNTLPGGQINQTDTRRSWDTGKYIFQHNYQFFWCYHCISILHIFINRIIL